MKKFQNKTFLRSDWDSMRRGEERTEMGQDCWIQNQAKLCFFLFDKSL
jgi:hypothetical protein